MRPEQKPRTAKGKSDKNDNELSTAHISFENSSDQLFYRSRGEYQWRKT
jgi:hypothetical protein